ncbi:MAG: hypothetical protein IPH53_01805 [Flavobacteriales bacterium]|nr:hypothetical protein [Flavobacteriales bacterium]
MLDANGSYSIDGIRFFVNLEVLGLNYGYEDTLTDLPNTLRTIHLDYSETRIRYVDHWPDSLRELSIRNDWYWNPTAGLQTIDVIDTLPPYLEYLDLYGHYLDTLPALPSTLRHLDVQRNQAVTSLPALPNELRHMNVSQTDIPALPVLPDSLIYLSCGSNLHLAVLGPLPAGLKELHVTAVVPLLPDLPALPPTLEVLEYGGATLGSIYTSIAQHLARIAAEQPGERHLDPCIASGIGAASGHLHEQCAAVAAAADIAYLPQHGEHAFRLLPLCTILGHGVEGVHQHHLHPEPAAQFERRFQCG